MNEKQGTCNNRNKREKIRWVPIASADQKLVLVYDRSIHNDVSVHPY